MHDRRSASLVSRICVTIAVLGFVSVAGNVSHGMIIEVLALDFSLSWTPWLPPLPVTWLPIPASGLDDWGRGWAGFELALVITGVLGILLVRRLHGLLRSRAQR